MSDLHCWKLQQALAIFPWLSPLLENGASRQSQAVLRVIRLALPLIPALADILGVKKGVIKACRAMPVELLDRASPLITVRWYEQDDPLWITMVKLARTLDRLPAEMRPKADADWMLLYESIRMGEEFFNHPAHHDMFPAEELLPAGLSHFRPGLCARLYADFFRDWARGKRSRFHDATLTAAGVDTLLRLLKLTLGDNAERFYTARMIATAGEGGICLALYLHVAAWAIEHLGLYWITNQVERAGSPNLASGDPDVALPHFALGRFYCQVSGTGYSVEPLRTVGEQVAQAMELDNCAFRNQYLLMPFRSCSRMYSILRDDWGLVAHLLVSANNEYTSFEAEELGGFTNKPPSKSCRLVADAFVDFLTQQAKADLLRAVDGAQNLFRVDDEIHKLVSATRETLLLTSGKGIRSGKKAQKREVG